jgi:hypothetical protein
VCQGKLMPISRTIRPGQRLATRPEQNFARKEVTNYARPKGWRMVGRNASEGIEPRNVHRRRWAKGCMAWKPAILHAIRRVCRDGPGSESVAGHPTAGIGTWESHAAPNGSFQQAEEVRRRYGGMAVGPTHSRGVVGVMPGEGAKLTRRGWQ